jgi:hypothetical protein
MNGSGALRGCQSVSAFFLAFGLCVSFTGCATRTLTGEPPKAKSEVATIRARGNYSSVTAIDGKPIPFGTGAMQVEPGEHDVSIRYEGTNGGQPGGAGLSGSLSVQPKPHTFRFTAKQGCEYELGYPTVWFGRKPYVKNLTSGKDLAGSLYVIDPKKE